MGLLDQSSHDKICMNDNSLLQMKQEEEQEHQHHDGDAKVPPTRNLDWAYLPKATIPPKGCKSLASCRLLSGSGLARKMVKSKDVSESALLLVLESSEE